MGFVGAIESGVDKSKLDSTRSYDKIVCGRKNADPSWRLHLYHITHIMRLHMVPITKLNLLVRFKAQSSLMFTIKPLTVRIPNE